MHPSHLDILWFNGVREMFPKEISRGGGGEGVNRFQNDHGMVIEEGGWSPKTRKSLRREERSVSIFLKDDHGRVTGEGAKTKYLQMI